MTIDKRAMLPAVTDAAYREILVIKSDFLAHFADDPPDTLAIGRGKLTRKSDGATWQGIAASFFRRSEMTEAIRVSRGSLKGIPCVVLGNPEIKRSFAGKTLDFDDERGFFLKEET